MDISPGWERPWDLLQQAFRALQERIELDRPGYAVGYSAMGPWAYGEFLGQLTVSGDPATQEFDDLVISLQCALDPGTKDSRALKFIVERGDGSEIAQMQERVLAGEPDERVVMEFTREAAEFLAEHTGLLLSHLAVIDR